MDKGRSTRGITLVELLVVMVLIAIIGSLVAPSVAAALENLSLETTASQLAAQFRKAQAQARITQTAVAAVYSGREFRFLKGPDPIGTFSLPASISVALEEGASTFVLLPSGQVAGPARFELLNRHGRKVVVELGLLSGIRALRDTR
jgi:prepilin-type N-terminal cleavage/methylation domain-containing protein